MNLQSFTISSTDYRRRHSARMQSSGAKAFVGGTVVSRFTLSWCHLSLDRMEHDCTQQTHVYVPKRTQIESVAMTRLLVYWYLLISTMWAPQLSKRSDCCQQHALKGIFFLTFKRYFPAAAFKAENGCIKIPLTSGVERTNTTSWRGFLTAKSPLEIYIPVVANTLNNLQIKKTYTHAIAYRPTHSNAFNTG